MRSLVALMFALASGCGANTPSAGAAANVSQGPDAGTFQLQEADVTFEPQKLDGGAGVVWLCRGSDGGVRAQVASSDNGPDYLSEGLRRYRAAGKWGFVDAHCKTAIVAAWDYVEPFKDGHARVCTGCVFVPDGEHTAVQGGSWNVVDRTGHVSQP